MDDYEHIQLMERGWDVTPLCMWIFHVSGAGHAHCAPVAIIP